MLEEDIKPQFFTRICTLLSSSAKRTAKRIDSCLVTCNLYFPAKLPNEIRKLLHVVICPPEESTQCKEMFARFAVKPGAVGQEEAEGNERAEKEQESCDDRSITWREEKGDKCSQVLAGIGLLKTFGTLIFTLHWLPVIAAILDLVSRHRVGQRCSL